MAKIFNYDPAKSSTVHIRKLKESLTERIAGRCLYWLLKYTGKKTCLEYDKQNSVYRYDLFNLVLIEKVRVCTDYFVLKKEHVLFDSTAQPLTSVEIFNLFQINT